MGVINRLNPNSQPQLFDLNAFSQLVKFLLGVDPESAAASDDDKSGGDKNQRDTDLRSTRRKWTSVQSREFGDLHKTLAYLGGIYQRLMSS